MLFIATIALAYGYYFIAIKDLRKSMQRSFSERAVFVDTYISMMQQQVDAMSKTIEKNYGLRISPEILKARYYNEIGGWGIFPDVRESGSGRINGSCTGSGTFPITQKVAIELSAVFSVDQQIGSAFEYNKSVAWIYYTSAEKFMYIAPDPGINEFHFSTSLYEKPFWLQAAPEHNPDLKQIITGLYDDAAGKGLMITISSPVKPHGRFTGVMSLDLGVDLLRKIVLMGDIAGETILVDENGRIVVRRGDFNINETYNLIPVTDQWFSSNDGCFWMRSELGGGELNILHRIKRTDFYLSAMFRSLFVWSLAGLMLIVFIMVKRDIASKRREALAQLEIKEALQESEARLKAFMENLPSLILIKDHELRPVFANNAYMHYFPFDEWAGKTPDEQFPPDIAEEMKFKDFEAIQKGSVSYEEDWTDMFGVKHNFFTQKFRIERTGKDPMLGVIISDITERKRAEEALQHSEERFKLAMIAVNDGLWDWNVALNKVYFDPRYYTIAGYEPDEFPHEFNEWSRRVHPDDVERTLTSIERHIQGVSSVLDIVFRFRRKDDSWMWIRARGRIVERDIDGRVIRMVGTHTDVTDLKEAEEKLIIFRETVENSTDAIGMSTPQGRHYYQNSAFSNLFGAIGENPPETLYVDKNKGYEVFKTIMSGGRWIGEVQMYSRERETLDIYLRAYANRDDDGKITALVGIHTDITASKKAEAERVRLQDQLSQSQKMESVGRLAGGVAHDFNNMLSVIIGQAELGLMKSNPSDSAHQRLIEIEKAARRSAELTSQLLAFARKQTVAPRVINLNEAISGMITMLRRLIGEDIDLIWKPGKNLWSVRIDPSQIDQILANLCVNSRDAITGTGMIAIETVNETSTDTRSATYSEGIPGDYVMLIVSDTGSGFTSEVYEHIFEPFFTTKSVGKGTGLGLAMVYGIVRQNNGHISVESEPGKGSIFRICFPRERGVQHTEENLSGNVETLSGNETILLVEDEPMLLEMSRTMLEELGYSVIAVSNPADAIKASKDYGSRIKLLITDVVMPGMNGRDLAEKLMASSPELISIYMSGYTADIIAHHGVLENGVNFIQKPFNISELAQKIKKALNG